MVSLKELRAAPIVTVGKKDGDDVRVCGDFSVTYSTCANVETYPMPKIEDMHSALRGCTVFSVLDLSIWSRSCSFTCN